VRSSISRFDLSKSGGGLLSHAARVLCHDQIFGCGTSSRECLALASGGWKPPLRVADSEFLDLTLRSTEPFVKYFAGAQLSPSAEVAA
jgi:hypothetical protein